MAGWYIIMIAFYLGLVYRIMIAFYWWLVYSYDRGILLNGWLLYHVLLVDDIAFYCLGVLAGI